jgi:hypothetical protein
MWDDHDRELPVRSARGIPTEQKRDQPSRSGKRPRTIKGHHIITLWAFKETIPSPLVRQQINPGNEGELVGEFRYLKLDESVSLTKEKTYLLTLSTQAGDGDHFHDPTPYDGLSPLINPHVKVIKSVFFRDKSMSRSLAIPSFSDLHPDHSTYRIPVGPTLRFQ